MEHRKPSNLPLPPSKLTHFMLGQKHEKVTGAPDSPSDRSSTSGGIQTSKPVRIIKISNKIVQELKEIAGKIKPGDQGKAGQGRLKLKTAKLKGILSKVGNRPVALVSIAGPYRQGKSFIMSYMVKYLRSLSTNRNGMSAKDDWMGTTESLEEGFKWRHGNLRETVGIWMWSEPFTIRTPEGAELDVLLMDTQGVFDAHTDKKDWATIVGLSLLTSSCLIFNIFRDIQANVFITLKEFIDFGLLASSSDGSQGKPFQKLTFLIRDWPNFEDYSYGADGGSRYLRFKLDEGNVDSERELRKQLEQCFEQLDCCLMSHPGKHVETKSYDGSVNKMDPDFAKNIRDFIEHLFNPKTLQPKVTAGQIVTGNDLLLYFEQFVQVFNSDTMPSSNDLNEATISICNQAIINKCFEIYKTAVEIPKSTSRRFWLDRELQEIHDNALTKTRQSLAASRIMGSSTNAYKVKDQLHKQCQDYYNSITITNTIARTEQIQGTIQDLKKYLQDATEKEIQRRRTGLDDFVHEDTFQALFEECNSSALSWLQDTLHLDSVNELQLQDIQTIKDVIISFKDAAKQMNLNKRLQALEELKQMVSVLADTYKIKLMGEIDKFRYWPSEELEKTDALLRDSVLQKLSAEYMNSSILAEGKQLLVESSQKDYINAHHLVQVRNDNFIMTCTQWVSELGKIYVEIIEKDDIKGSMKDAHLHASEECEKQLLAFNGFTRLPSTQKQNFLSDLHSSIEERCMQVVEKWSPRKRQDLLQEYKKQMQTAYGSGHNIIPHGDLDTRHSEEKAAVIHKFEQFLHELPVSQQVQEKLFATSKVMLKEFENDIETHMEIIREKESLRLEALEANIQGFLSLTKTKYLKWIRKINLACIDQDEYLPLCSDARQRAFKFFKDKCLVNLGTAAPVDQFLQELESFVKTIAEFKTVQGKILEISGPVIKFSRELLVLNNMEHYLVKPIQEVRWIASRELIIDENLCSDFWFGKNLAMYGKKISVSGSGRIIDVSGTKGQSAASTVPGPPSEETGVNGVNGEDGEPGESGGNVLIMAETIVHGEELRVISMGGAGGNGQPGSDGSNGKNGTDGDDRFQMTLQDLKRLFPSPAKFFNHIDAKVKTAKESFNNLAKGRPVENLSVRNPNNYCFHLETEEGAHIRYGFYQGVLQGLISGRSFYTICQGAPGTNGQPGGCGGLGGRGGASGNAGAVEIPKHYENVIKIGRKPGVAGRAGVAGTNGQDGVDGRQGTDYAIVDPYAGLWIPPANLLSKRRFSGNLEKVVVEEGEMYKNVARFVNAWTHPFRWIRFAVQSKDQQVIPKGQEELYLTVDDAAYCPHESKYISFIPSLEMRPLLQVYPVQKKNEYAKRITKTRNKPQIVKQELINKYGEF